eukprot:TRINITY_DN117494_c0_g1_i1.p1 TRINITY_DN117494_c0_g1~~TRINITY_DN117494_c0_g1_i1.p1  ORF type:complete len:140 (-),score=19.28 TRINITY_DN117494_c0_g1_i1:151-570(-)
MMPLMRTSVVLGRGSTVASIGHCSTKHNFLPLHPALLERRQSFTSWWHKWVDGKNPASPNASRLSNFLRQEGIDPYLLPRDEIEDFRKKYLTVLNWDESVKKVEDEEGQAEKAWELLQQKKGNLLTKWKGLYKLPPPAE